MESSNQQNPDLEGMLEMHFYSRDHNPEFTLAYANESGIYGIPCLIEDFLPVDRTERRC